MIQNHLKFHWTLFPIVRELHRHDGDASSVNDHMGVLENHNDPCAFHEYTSHWTINVESYSLCYFDTRLVRNVIIDIIMRSSISLLTRLFNLFPVWFQPYDLLDVILPSGPRVSSITRMKKSLSWYIRLNISLRNTQCTPLWSPCYGVTVDVLKTNFGDSNQIWSHGLGIGDYYAFIIIAAMNFVT
jgi:hypothetical protein